MDQNLENQSLLDFGLNFRNQTYTYVFIFIHKFIISLIFIFFISYIFIKLSYNLYLFIKNIFN